MAPRHHAAARPVATVRRLEPRHDAAVVTVRPLEPRHGAAVATVRPLDPRRPAPRPAAG